MKTLKMLLLVAIVLCVDATLPEMRKPRKIRKGKGSLKQFRKTILCTKPGSWPIRDYTNYGCYCGKGGSGTPVDDLDTCVFTHTASSIRYSPGQRCCQVHDMCYKAAKKHPECRGFLGIGFFKKLVPYVRRYVYTCNKKTKTVTCSETNDECKMFVCECDRKAAECFANTEWNKEYYRMDQARCKE